jgi:hypothetical protein
VLQRLQEPGKALIHMPATWNVKGAARISAAVAAAHAAAAAAAEPAADNSSSAAAAALDDDSAAAGLQQHRAAVLSRLAQPHTAAELQLWCRHCLELAVSEQQLIAEVSQWAGVSQLPLPAPACQRALGAVAVAQQQQLKQQQLEQQQWASAAAAVTGSSTVTLCSAPELGSRVPNRAAQPDWPGPLPGARFKDIDSQDIDWLYKAWEGEQQ